MKYTLLRRKKKILLRSISYVDRICYHSVLFPTAYSVHTYCRLFIILLLVARSVFIFVKKCTSYGIDKHGPFQPLIPFSAKFNIYQGKIRFSSLSMYFVRRAYVWPNLGKVIYIVVRTKRFSNITEAINKFDNKFQGLLTVEAADTVLQLISETLPRIPCIFTRLKTSFAFGARQLYCQVENCCVTMKRLVLTTNLQTIGIRKVLSSVCFSKETFHLLIRWAIMQGIVFTTAFIRNFFFLLLRRYH